MKHIADAIAKLMNDKQKQRDDRHKNPDPADIQPSFEDPKQESEEEAFCSHCGSKLKGEPDSEASLKESQ